MSKEYPRIEMCDCGEDFQHAHIYASGEVRSDSPVYSKEMGKGMIKYGKKVAHITAVEAAKLMAQLDELDLPETQEDAWEAFSDETKNRFRRAARRR